VGLVVVPGEDKVLQAALVLKDPLMQSNRVKVLVLMPERLLCLLRDAGKSAARMGLKCSRGGQDTLIRGAGCVI